MSIELNLSLDQAACIGHRAITAGTQIREELNKPEDERNLSRLAKAWGWLDAQLTQLHDSASDELKDAIKNSNEAGGTKP